MDKAALFVDGRYTLQVRAQTDTVVRAARSGGGRTAGLDSGQSAERRQAGLRPLADHRPWRGGSAPGGRKSRRQLVACDSNPIDAVWKDQPPPPATAVPHALNLAGELIANWSCSVPTITWRSAAILDLRWRSA